MGKPAFDPLMETLDAWTKRYGLTKDERSTLFGLVSGAPSVRDLARLNDDPVLPPASHVRSTAKALALKVGAQSSIHAAVKLLREAVSLATFDRQARDRKREDPEDDGG